MLLCHADIILLYVKAALNKKYLPQQLNSFILN